MKKRARFVAGRVSAVVAAVATVACTSGCGLDSLPLPGGADVGDNSYAVTIQFRDVLDLVPQSAVKVDDVTVGKVEDISLDGWTADVKVRLNGKVDLPQNALATIRQTSLLGEKFVSLSPPTDEAATGELADGDTIPLTRSGRNPEVEEVLGALSLLLNGGGVAQLKTISRELGDALGGNETEVRGVVHQLDTFMGQLDDNKAAIVAAIDSLNELSKTARDQEQSIVNTVDDLPAALKLLDEQRGGLVRMLHGLDRLSPVAVRVIKSSKAATLADLRALNPILSKLAEAGDAVPKSFQLLLTYPFVDAAVGMTPEEAAAFKQGDYTNLAVTLDLDLGDLPNVGLPDLPNIPNLPSVPDLPTLPVPTLTLPTVTLPSLPPITLIPGATITVPGGPTITVPSEITAPTVVTLPTIGGNLPLPLAGQQQPQPRSAQAQRMADAGYDEDLALLLLQGVSR